MNRFRFLFLLPFFFMEVRVHASTEKSNECWGHTVPCAVSAESKVKRIEGKGFLATLAPGALMHQGDAGVMQVVRGLVFVELKESGVKLKTPFAEFSCPSHCSALIERREDQVTLKSLEGFWVIARKGERAQKYQVRAGWQILVSEVTDAGVAEMEFPQSLPWMSTVQEWATLFPGKSEEFKSELTRFRKVWLEGVEAASALHAATAGRTIASYEAGVNAERARQKAREKEDQSLRELFRKKILIDP